jgi:hypothetical protein
MYKCPAEATNTATIIMTARITLLTAIALFSTSLVLANPVPWDLQDSEAVLSEPKSGHSGGFFDNASGNKGFDNIGGTEKDVEPEPVGPILDVHALIAQVKVVLGDVSTLLDKVEDLNIRGVKQVIHHGMSDAQPVVELVGYMMDDVDKLPIPGIPKDQLPQIKTAILNAAQSFPDYENQVNKALDDPMVGMALSIGKGTIVGTLNGIIQKAYQKMSSGGVFEEFERYVEDYFADRALI